MKDKKFVESKKGKQKIYNEDIATIILGVVFAVLIVVGLLLGPV